MYRGIVLTYPNHRASGSQRTSVGTVTGMANLFPSQHLWRVPMLYSSRRPPTPPSPTPPSPTPPSPTPPSPTPPSPTWRGEFRRRPTPYPSESSRTVAALLKGRDSPLHDSSEDLEHEGDEFEEEEEEEEPLPQYTRYHVDAMDLPPPYLPQPDDDPPPPSYGETVRGDLAALPAAAACTAAAAAAARDSEETRRSLRLPERLIPSPTRIHSGTSLPAGPPAPLEQHSDERASRRRQRRQRYGRVIQAFLSRALLPPVDDLAYPLGVCGGF
ncbi:uncharacterized protein B0T15DRAFT_59578 [Chaetomium strumarium]|uniref:Uncharacterized protein n=1 Tax=Chaetomium strumarium TaxID=1170767 RepID=A0AAJ0H3G7_9PEZI|nr:hypothetical protein B0T15DRAFT_59578 [Chaetomium strumarium]